MPLVSLSASLQIIQINSLFCIRSKITKHKVNNKYTCKGNSVISVLYHTAGCSVVEEFSLTVTLLNPVPGFPTDQRNGDKEFVIRRAATNRVLNVLRHWVSKHSQVQFTFPSVFFLFSFCLSMPLQKKNNTSVMTLLLFLCWPSGL